MINGPPGPLLPISIIDGKLAKLLISGNIVGNLSNYKKCSTDPSFSSGSVEHTVKFTEYRCETVKK